MTETQTANPDSRERDGKSVHSVDKALEMAYTEKPYQEHVNVLKGVVGRLEAMKENGESLDDLKEQYRLAKEQDVDGEAQIDSLNTDPKTEAGRKLATLSAAIYALSGHLVDGDPEYAKADVVDAIYETKDAAEDESETDGRLHDLGLQRHKPAPQRNGLPLRP